MHMPSGKTNLIFTERKLLGEEVRLVAYNKKIEIYAIEKGLEMFKGYLDLQTNPVFTESALSEIRAAIKKRPISKDSLNWLAALQNYGLLDLYGEKTS
jgi:hypothetical protein